MGGDTAPSVRMLFSTRPAVPVRTGQSEPEGMGRVIVETRWASERPPWLYSQPPPPTRQQGPCHRRYDNPVADRSGLWANQSLGLSLGIRLVITATRHAFEAATEFSLPLHSTAASSAQLSVQAFAWRWAPWR